MARPASIALGGFFHTPPTITAQIAKLLKPEIGDGWCNYVTVDPCAGEGDALVDLAFGTFRGDEALKPTVALKNIHAYACEMEATRYRALSAKKKRFSDAAFTAVRGDTMRLHWEVSDGYNPTKGASLMLLNPPYEHGVLEAKFLDRFSGMLMQKGVLVYIIPAYSLHKSAEILSREFEDLRCYRFPDPEYDRFKQVVVYGIKRTSLTRPVDSVVRMIRGWGEDVQSLPVLPENGRPIYEVPGHAKAGFTTWKMKPVEADALRRSCRPWHFTDKAGRLRPIPGILPDELSGDLLRKEYPLATVPKPAHVATAIAAGVFNGSLIQANDPTSGLPALYIKGVFHKEFVEQDEKTNKDGEVTGKIKTQQPRLVVTVLDVKSHVITTIKSEVVVSGSMDVTSFTMGDLLEHYGQSLLQVMLKNCPVLHDPNRDGDEIEIAPTTRTPYKAQKHAVMACLKLLGGVDPPRHLYHGRMRANKNWRKGLGAYLLGEIGAGKTTVSLTTMKSCAKQSLAAGKTYRALVMCPPHLIDSWKEQVVACIPETRVYVIEDILDVDTWVADDAPGMTIGLFSKETAKLSHSWDGVHAPAVLPHETRVDSADTWTPAVNRYGKRPTLRLYVPRIGSSAELFVAVETSNDLVTWTLTGSTVVTEKGEHSLYCDDAGKWLRVSWSCSGSATFGVEPPTTHDIGTCPKCGESAMMNPVELANKRAKCAAKISRPYKIQFKDSDGVMHVNPCQAAVATKALVGILIDVAPWTESISRVSMGMLGEKLRASSMARYYAQTPEKIVKAAGVARDVLMLAAGDTRWRSRTDRSRVRQALDLAMQYRETRTNHREEIDSAIIRILWALGDTDLIEELARKLHAKGSEGEHGDYNDRHFARELLLMLNPASERQQLVSNDMKAAGHDEPKQDYNYGRHGHTYATPWQNWRSAVRTIEAGGIHQSYGVKFSGPSNSPLLVDGVPLGHVSALILAFESLGKIGLWVEGAECGTELFQAIPQPRKFPVADYIVKRHKSKVDFLILDEIQDFAEGGSAQSFAAQRLIGIGAPTLLLTGSPMNGYARSMFAMQWAIDPLFRQEFNRDDVSLFVEKFGYLKKIEEDREIGTGKLLTYGSQSDRVERVSRVVGCAPGVLPLFLLRYLLRISVTLHKSEFGLDLPTCREIVVPIKPDDDMMASYIAMQKSLITAIKADRYGPNSGKLFGMLSELPSCLDRATNDVGNIANGDYEISYPAEKVVGRKGTRIRKEDMVRGASVAYAKGFPASRILPKEAWMIETIKASLAEGRNTLVFAWNERVLPRLQRILSAEFGYVPLLSAKKVDSVDRQAWINEQVIAKGARIMVVNPKAVATGLNNLVHFNDEIFMQNPACDAICFEQAKGRVDRLGQKLDTRIYFPEYEGSIQQIARKLLLHKVAVLRATTGLDAAGALAAAGVGASDKYADMAIGKAIYQMLTGERSMQNDSASLQFGVGFAA